MVKSCRALIVLSTGTALRVPISSSSSGVTEGCSRGALRPYQAQIEIKATAGRLAHSNARCHPITDIRFAMSGGVSAAPRLNPIVCKPCTVVQWRGRKQNPNKPAETQEKHGLGTYTHTRR